MAISKKKPPKTTGRISTTNSARSILLRRWFKSIQVVASIGIYTNERRRFSRKGDNYFLYLILSTYIQFNFGVWSSLFIPVNCYSGERCGPRTSCLKSKKREGWDHKKQSAQVSYMYNRTFMINLIFTCKKKNYNKM